MFRHVLFWFLVALTALAANSPAVAQSTNATPVIVETSKPLDSAAVPVSSDTDKKFVSDYIAAAKTATGNNILTAAANLTGVSYYFSSPSNPSTIADAARAALEICEYNNGAPCVILSINGNDARSPDGAWPAQPEMLVKVPGSKFDVWAIPFNSQYNRAIGGFLSSAPFPSVVVVSNAGGWSSGTGKSVLEAIDSAFASCTKSYPNNNCILYSVNGLVLMAR